MTLTDDEDNDDLRASLGSNLSTLLRKKLGPFTQVWRRNTRLEAEKFMKTVVGRCTLFTLLILLSLKQALEGVDLAHELRLLGARCLVLVEE